MSSCAVLRLLGVLLDHARDKVAVVDAAGTCTYVNAAVEEVLGFAPEEYEGRSVFEFVHPDDADEVRETFERTIAADTHEQASVEYRHRTREGDYRWVESRMSNVTDARLDGYVISSRDITDRVEAESERELSHARLRETAAAAGDVLWMFDRDWTEPCSSTPRTRRCTAARGRSSKATLGRSSRRSTRTTSRPSGRRWRR
ncbi:PAS domain-containing protein [Halobaculum litoreum]|uniref:histidine kinase n=1 Tax=Halobaculum litoreum TaxID=3031998 RepID=A0ABD5XTA5_9EURY